VLSLTVQVLESSFDDSGDARKVVGANYRQRMTNDCNDVLAGI